MKHAPNKKIYDQCDVLVVGSGPNGLTIAEKLGKIAKVKVIDKEGICGNLKKLPPSFPFASETQENLGIKLGKDKSHKVNVSELVEYFAQYSQCQIDTCEALSLRGSDGRFEVDTNKGVIQSKKVILATGIMGKPRPFFPSVPNILRYPVDSNVKNEDILIIGGGDNAALAVIKYYEHNNIHWVYRSDTETMLRKIFRLWKDKIPPILSRINVYPQTTVEELTERHCKLSNDAHFEYDRCFALIGYEYDQHFLSSFGIKFEKNYPVLNFSTGESSNSGVYLCGIVMGQALVEDKIKIPFLKDTDIVTNNLSAHVAMKLKNIDQEVVQ